MVGRKINWYKYTSPASFYPLAGKMIPWFAVLSALLLVVGLYIGFFVAPKDAVQGEAYRIIYIHVPAAWMAMFLYALMAIYAGLGLAFNARLWSMMATAIAPTGALFSFLALWTGALWGKPMWGTWWVWDARLTSFLVLFIMYLGLIALWRAFDDPARAGRIAAVLVLVGSMNIPIIKFSVDWWNTLHQPASILRIGGPSIDPSMLYPLLVMLAAFVALFATLLLSSMRAEIYRRRIRAAEMIAARPAVVARQQTQSAW
jgi:heme exporter protein C